MISRNRANDRRLSLETQAGEGGKAASGWRRVSRTVRIAEYADTKQLPLARWQTLKGCQQFAGDSFAAGWWLRNGTCSQTANR